MLTLRLRLILLVIGLLALAPATAGAVTTAQLAALGGKPCSAISAFTCVTLTVPLDHRNPGDGQTTRVAFAIRPAGSNSKGLFVTATGGPGSSGISSADAYFANYPESVRRSYDFVFFDQRGIGRSGGLDCPKATASSSTGTTTIEAGTIKFVNACVAELSSTRLLPYIGTSQTIEDLESLRLALGGPSVWLIGESYGTQYGQAYAAAHPAAMKGLIIDGVVDLTLSGPDFWVGAAGAFEHDLDMTLALCDRRAACRRDATRSAGRVYDQLQARLARGPISVAFPLATGRRTNRQLTGDLLSAAVSGELYGTYGRMMLQRALAAAGQGDLVPILRLAYSDASLDPQTLKPIVDPSFSNAMYYGVDCRDYAYYSGTQAERSAAFLAAATVVDQRFPRIGGATFLSDYPCLWWPGPAPDPTRPAPLVNAGIPTLVLTATADPITPVGQARAVYSRLADGYLITTTGGPHVTFGRGNPCPDNLVNAFLATGTLPAQRETSCPGVNVQPYVAIAPRQATSFAGLRQALTSFDTQLRYTPEYRYWAGDRPTGFGCGVSGSVRVTPTASGERYQFSGCAFTSGVTVSGSGTRLSSGRLVLNLVVSGRWTDHVRFVRSDDGATLTPL